MPGVEIKQISSEEASEYWKSIDDLSFVFLQPLLNVESK